MEWLVDSKRRRRHRRLWTFTLAGLTCIFIQTVGLATPVQAAEFTDLLDAADDMDDFKKSTYDPFDISLEPSFDFTHETAQILRERPCVASKSNYGPAVQNNPYVEEGDCQEPGIVDRKELLYRHTEARLSFDLRIGLAKDLELHASVPYVLSSTYSMKYANEADRAQDKVDETNSSVDPSESQIRNNAQDVYGPNDSGFDKLDQFQAYRFFDVGGEYSDSTYRRSGIGDPSVGFAWAPYNDYRDDTKATLLFGFDWVFPVGNIRKRNNDAVGDGQHKLQFRVASSKKFNWIEPYFGIDYELPLLSGNSPIQDLKEVDPENKGQVVTQPPQTGDVTIGSEFIVHEDEEQHQRYAIDARFSFGYTSEGRDYSPLYEHMVNSNCNGRTVGEVAPEFDGNGNLQNPSDFACSWLVQRPANFRGTSGPETDADPVYNPSVSEHSGRHLATNGIMTVDDYGTLAGELGFYAQPSKYFQLKLSAGLSHQLEHILTNARTGQDVADEPGMTEADRTDNKVDLSGEAAELERNPVYNPTYDSPGTRFKVDGHTSWNFMLTTAFQF